jgi:hypothetical protein
LTDAIGGTPDDLLTYPGYALLSLSDVIGPRYYFLARHPGWLDAFSEPGTGALQLARVMGPDLAVFLDDVAQVRGRTCTGGVVGARGGRQEVADSGRVLDECGQTGRDSLM